MNTPIQKTIEILSDLVCLPPTSVRAWFEDARSTTICTTSSSSSHHKTPRLQPCNNNAPAKKQQQQHPDLLPLGPQLPSAAAVHRCFAAYERDYLLAAAHQHDDVFPSATEFLVLLGTACRCYLDAGTATRAPHAAGTEAAVLFGLRLLHESGVPVTPHLLLWWDDGDDDGLLDSAAWVAYYVLRALREGRAEEDEARWLRGEAQEMSAG